MSLEKINEVDAIGIDNQTEAVVLSIIDDLDWEEEKNHLILLQEKINVYLSFIESGEIFEVYPDAKDRNIEIKIFTGYEFPEIGIEFLNKALEIVEEAGFKLSWKVLG
ncbi:MAG: DUF6572 domain-containing protein [Deltaproteobacteria bacterium]